MGIKKNPDEFLERMIGKHVVVFLANKNALRGTLCRYTLKQLVLKNDQNEESLVSRIHVTTIKEGK